MVNPRWNTCGFILLFLLHPSHNTLNSSVAIWPMISMMEGAVSDIKCLFCSLAICSNNFSKHLGKKGKCFCMLCFCAHLPISLSGCSVLPLKAQQSVWSSCVVTHKNQSGNASQAGCFTAWWNVKRRWNVKGNLLPHFCNYFIIIYDL